MARFASHCRKLLCDNYIVAAGGLVVIHSPTGPYLMLCRVTVAAGLQSSPCARCTVRPCLVRRTDRPRVRCSEVYVRTLVDNRVGCGGNNAYSCCVCSVGDAVVRGPGQCGRY